MAVFTVMQITSANAMIYVEKCNSTSPENCRYYPDSLRGYSSDTSGPVTSVNTNGVGRGTSADACHEQQSTNYCWMDDRGICANNGTGHDGQKLCIDVCEAMGYDAYVTGYSGGTYTWGCACAYDANFAEWKSYSTGVMRKYTISLGNNCAKNAVATNEYKCAPGYYGPGNSTTGCKVCPANATCNGNPDKNNATHFICSNDGYYNNAANNGCIACPDSKEGGLGWDANGNGIKAYYSGFSIEECAIHDGTKLYDSTGTFVLDSGDDNEDCFYIK